MDVEELVCDEPPLEEFAVVELWVDALLLPPGCVEVDEPVEVVVPADDPDAEPVCDEPEAPVVADAVPLPLEGVGLIVPAGLCELDVPLPFPFEAWPVVHVPAPVFALPAPEPAALAPLEFDGEVEVLEPVWVAAVPVEGVELKPEPPAAAFALLPVEAEADDPPDPDEFADVELFVEVEALAEPPGVAVGVGEAVGVGVGVGEAVGVGVGVGEVVPAGVEVWDPVSLPVEPDPWCVVAVGVGDGAGVGLGVGLGVLAVELVVVDEVVDVVADPPLMDGFTLMIG